MRCAIDEGKEVRRERERRKRLENPVWRNGSRTRFKIGRTKVRSSSNLETGTKHLKTKAFASLGFLFLRDVKLT